MELREILNRAEGIVINAKSFAAGDNFLAARSELFKLKLFLVKETPTALPMQDESKTELPAQVEQPAESAAAEPEGKPGSGVVSETAKSEGKPDAGIVSESEKSQNREGSGVS